MFVVRPHESKRKYILYRLGRCLECRSGPDGYLYCQTDVHTLGLTMNGGLAEYLVSDSAHIFPLPNEISDLDAAPLMCAGVRCTRCALSLRLTV